MDDALYLGLLLGGFLLILAAAGLIADWLGEPERRDARRRNRR